MAERGDGPNHHAFGTFVTHPADAGSAPKAGGDRSSRTFGKKDMNSHAIIAYFLLSVTGAYAASEPPIALPVALELSTEYLKNSKMTRNDYFVSGATLQNEKDGKQKWHFRYDPRSDTPAKGDWFIVVVEMDRSCGMIYGK
jgi:hypothetical protein